MSRHIPFTGRFQNVVFACCSIAVACLFLGCFLGTQPGPVDDAQSTQQELPKELCPYAEPNRMVDDFDPLYRIIYPNGGEVFAIGQQCTVKVTAEYSGNAVLEIAIGKMMYKPDDFNQSMKLPGDSCLVFMVPESLSTRVYDPEKKKNVTVSISSITDSSLLKLTDYADLRYYDYTDCSFIIAGETPCQ